ncbi:GDSL esterase/lipase At1g71250-like [Lotus japonicus]|uniref:GDSL esterase/lipase At1g71250-like n=1 Tax=Lotus japonicus TaxID=34305 RepID=UPI002587A6D7|nr:GDSL esterase/lipase At1g71250-like [Lotus japonicus]
MGRLKYVRIPTMILSLLLCLNEMVKVNSQSSNVPALFVFGDSSVDVGNNNLLNSMAKANFFPYGIDFNNGSTGRFSNGKSLIDFIGEFLDVPSPPPFASISSVGSGILNGVNFASSSGGILDESGRHYGERYSLSHQILNFNDILNKYKTMMNASALSQYLAKAITIMVVGNNDYINNYLMPELYTTSLNYTTQEFGNLLVNNYMQNIMTLYNSGLRKFFLAGIGPLGCTPSQRARGFAPPGSCVDSVNQMVGPFNEGLKSTVDQLNKNHSDAIFVYGNSFRVLGDILINPAAYSLTIVDRACCGIGIYRGQISCLPLQFPCLLRNQYVFWDAFHPTESVVHVLAWRAHNDPPDDSYPINIKQMALL